MRGTGPGDEADGSAGPGDEVDGSAGPGDEVDGAPGISTFSADFRLLGRDLRPAALGISTFFD